ncbi:dimethylamine monooxygenase subunit DmmA family protein [Rhodococcus sp. NPDC003322]
MSAGFDRGGVGGEPDAIDSAGRVFLVAALGRCPDGRRVAAEWVAQAIALGRTATVMIDADAERVRTAVLGASAGTRVMLAGPERDVMAAVAGVRAAGALPCEVTTHLTAPGAVAVFCPHCATAADTAAAPGDRVPCRSCGTVLEVRSHRSSHHGSYLGAVAEVA